MIRRSLSTFTVDMVRASSQRHADQRPEPQHGRRDAEPEAEDRTRERARPERRAGAQADLRPRIATRLLIFARAWPYVSPVSASTPTTWLRKNNVRACESVIGSSRKLATTIADWPSVSEGSKVSSNPSHRNLR